MISIIIPTYNHGSALPACLDSILAQSYQDFEIIIVDDGSSDNTEKIVNDYITNHEGAPIKYQKIEHGGAPKARNRGAAESQGEFLIFADADLILKPQMLAELKKALDNHANADYAYSGFYFGWKRFRGQPFDSAKLQQMNFIHTSALIRREKFTGFDEELKRFQDWDLWLTMLKNGSQGVLVADELFRARVTRAGISKWRPSFWYKIWPILGWSPMSARRYEEAKRIIKKKHNLL